MLVRRFMFAFVGLMLHQRVPLSSVHKHIFKGRYYNCNFCVIAI